METERPATSDSPSRTDSQLWIEVFAVLCLAYIPYLFSALTAMNGVHSAGHSLAYGNLYLIVYALQVSMPLLVILGLARDRWSLFGIVRPKWITDALVGCAICVGIHVFYQFFMSLLPSSMLIQSAFSQIPRRAAPEGIVACLLLSVACIASGFAQELVFRGYLIARLERLLRSTSLAVLISTAMFASYHLYMGITPAVGTLADGLVYAVSFCLLRRLWPICVAHALYNFILYV